MADWCEGSKQCVTPLDERMSDNTAACPVCGRPTSFDRMTGRFARHHTPLLDDEGDPVPQWVIDRHLSPDAEAAREAGRG